MDKWSPGISRNWGWRVNVWDHRRAAGGIPTTTDMAFILTLNLCNGFAQWHCWGDFGTEYTGSFPVWLLTDGSKTNKQRQPWVNMVCQVFGYAFMEVAKDVAWDSFFATVIKYPNKKKLRGENMLNHKSIIAGSWDWQELILASHIYSQEQRETSACVISTQFTSSILRQLRTQTQGDADQGGLGFSVSVNVIETISHRQAHRPTWTSQTLTET